jgi:hypothetical protein
VTDVEVQGEYQFEHRENGSNPEHLQLLEKWLIEREVEEVVMEPRRNIEAGVGSTGTVLET